MRKKLPIDKSNCNTGDEGLQGKDSWSAKKIERERRRIEGLKRYETATYHTSGRFKGLPTHLSGTTKRYVRPAKRGFTRRIGKALETGAFVKHMPRLWVKSYLYRYSKKFHDLLAYSAKLGREAYDAQELADALRYLYRSSK